MNYQKLRGVIVPMVTPCTPDDHIDLDATFSLVDFLIEHGIHGLFPLGTTGEGPLFSIAERKAFAEAVLDAVAGRVPVIIHSGAITTEETIELTRHAQKIGAFSAAVIPPYYFKIPAEAIVQHFRAVARAVPDFPIYLYDNPSVTSNRFTVDMVRQLAESEPNIVGMKDSSGSLETLFTARNFKDSTFNTASGPDKLMTAAFALGIEACVSGNANVIPEVVVALYNAAQANDWTQARIWQERLNAVCTLLGDGGNLSMYKGVLALRGVPVGQVRPPLSVSASHIFQENWNTIQNIYLPDVVLH